MAMEIDPNAVIAALGQQVGALAADNARLRVGLDTAEAELTKVTRERDEAEQAYLDAEGELAKLYQDAEDELAKLRDEARQAYQDSARPQDNTTQEALDDWDRARGLSVHNPPPRCEDGTLPEPGEVI